MIPRTHTSWQTQNWQDQLKGLITDPKELLKELKLPLTLLEQARSSAQLFELRVTRSYLHRIQPGNLNDPLLKQILPLGAEQYQVLGFEDDPLDEASFSPHKGLIHKYTGRVLVLAATQCAINCRYCFRRHFPYEEHKASRHDWENTLNYIRQDKSISEVILSGADPLVINDRQLQWLVQELDNIAHVHRLRIHSRLPIVLPARITDGLLAVLSQARVNVIIVVHTNHAQEFDHDVNLALRRIRHAGITLLNQSVLLKGVNDSADILAELSETLFANGALPYYLHLLDKVSGTMHFDVPENTAIAIHRELMNRLPGYLVPKLVREIANERSKTPIF